MWMGLVLAALVSMDLKAANARVSTPLATGGLISSMFMRGGMGRGVKLHFQNTVACIVSGYSFVCSCANLRDGTEFNGIHKGLRSRIGHRYTYQGCGALYVNETVRHLHTLTFEHMGRSQILGKKRVLSMSVFLCSYRNTGRSMG